jgi:hypothetical protein
MTSGAHQRRVLSFDQRLSAKGAEHSSTYPTAAAGKINVPDIGKQVTAR